MLSILLLLPLLCPSHAFVNLQPFLGGQHQFAETTNQGTTFFSSRLEAVKKSAWANSALLISSFSDGVVNSERARDFLRDSLLKSMLTKEQKRAESQVESSVVASPCNGPDIESLGSMEDIDCALKSLSNDSIDFKSIFNKIDPTIRLLYVPTAMYALRKDSTRSPGKQRQRARADGKKRRTQVVSVLNEIFDNAVQVHTVTMDFDDDSVKQPQGSENDSVFPKNGKEALTSWDPHFIYVEGGNTFWLYHCMDKGNYFDDLTSIITGEGYAVYCGKSAGAIVAGESIETGTWKGWDDPSVVPGMEEYSDWIGVKGLNILGGDSIFPHMSQQYQELVEEKKKTLDSKVHCLTDEDVCCVKGDNEELIFVTAEKASYAEAS